MLNFGASKPRVRGGPGPPGPPPGSAAAQFVSLALPRPFQWNLWEAVKLYMARYRYRSQNEAAWSSLSVSRRPPPSSASLLCTDLLCVSALRSACISVCSSLQWLTDGIYHTGVHVFLLYSGYICTSNAIHDDLQAQPYLYRGKRPASGRSG